MPGVRVLVTTFAPITLPYFENIVFKSLARVDEDKPDTQRFREAFADDEDDVLLPPLVDFELVAVDDEELFADDFSGNSI